MFVIHKQNVLSLPLQREAKRASKRKAKELTANIKNKTTWITRGQ